MENFFNKYLAEGLIGKLGFSYGSVPFFIAAVLCIVIPYLLGSVNFAIILSKKVHHDDVRTHGSGNAGATNMLRTYGVKAAAATFAWDFFKAILSALMGLFVMPYRTGFVAVSSLACLLGHAFPVYFHFKGGKGVACTAGILLVINPPVFLLMFLCYVLIVGLSMYVSLGSVICAALIPLANIFMPFYVAPVPPVEIVATLLMGILVVFLHRENIKRLWQGTESKLSFHKKKEQ